VIGETEELAALLLEDGFGLTLDGEIAISYAVVYTLHDAGPVILLS